MKRKCLFVISLVVTLVASACSTGHDFVVINTTNGSIEVQYRIKRCTGTADREVEPPSKLRMSEFQKSNHVWLKLSKEQFKYDAQICTYAVVVGPHEALLVGSTFNYAGPNSKDSERHFAIEAISVTGPLGAVRLDGRQAQTQFKGEGSGDYILRYE